MFLRTSGNSADTSLPKVMAIMVFCMDSFLKHNEHVVRHILRNGFESTFHMHTASCIDSVSDRDDGIRVHDPYTSPALSSYVSPFLGAVNALLILFTAIIPQWYPRRLSRLSVQGRSEEFVTGFCEKRWLRGWFRR